MPTALKVIIGIVGVLVVVAVVDFVVNRGESQVESALATVQQVAGDQLGMTDAASGDGEAGPAAESAPPASAAPADRATPPLASAVVPAVDEEPTAIAAGEVTAVAIPLVSSGAPAGDTATPPATSGPPRQAYFLQGQTASWTTFEPSFTGPVAIRAAGQIEVGSDRSGPDGLATSSFDAGADSRWVLPGAPYLALIGRVCSTRECSDPFLVGSGSVVCPSAFGGEGALQLWTNNYARIDGGRTSLGFTRSIGGYSFYVEPASDDQCGTSAGRVAGLTTSNDADVLATGGTLRHPEFAISSSQSAWKPFFLPLDVPLRITASGSMRPVGGAEATGPDGIVVPNAATWHYPGQPTVVVDGGHRLFDRTLPYQALIGRTCGDDGCSAPFLVGTGTVVCATAPRDGRLELWVNHIVRAAGLLASQTPLTFDAFDLQQRQGSYHFTVTRALASECA